MTLYTPAQFAESRLPVLHAFIDAYPLASIVTLAAGKVDANHVPLILDKAHGPFGRLRGHVARANPVWREVEAGSEVLVLFHGPDSYVSPGYYPSKKEHGKVVPTWNYGVVHARGRITWNHDRAWLHGLVDELTGHHEASQATPWKVSDAPDDYIGKMIDAIVGLEIPIESLVGKLKLSQNRSAEDRAGVLAGLDARAEAGSAELVRWMRGPGSDGTAT